MVYFDFSLKGLSKFFLPRPMKSHFRFAWYGTNLNRRFVFSNQLLRFRRK